MIFGSLHVNTIKTHAPNIIHVELLTYQLTGVFSLTISSAITLQAVTVIAARCVRTVALDAGFVQALVDVDVAVAALEPGPIAVALVPIQFVCGTKR